MTLAETLLSKLAESRATGTSRRLLTEADAASGWSVTLTLEKTDALSCQLSELSLARAAGPAYDTASWAASLAKRVTGLMEPLRVIEVDSIRDEAILRSDAPTVRNNMRAHYELHLRGGRRAELTRFIAATDSTAKREPTTFTLTHEVLGKLIDDLTARPS